MKPDFDLLTPSNCLGSHLAGGSADDQEGQFRLAAFCSKLVQPPWVPPAFAQGIGLSGNQAYSARNALRHAFHPRGFASSTELHCTIPVSQAKKTKFVS